MRNVFAPLLRIFRPHQKQTYKPVVLVTGASTGIGLALAKLLRAKGEYRVVLTARESSIPRFAKNGIVEDDDTMIVPLDVQVLVQCQRLYTAIEKRWRGIDILINNAGISYRAVVEHMDEAHELDSLRTNYIGPMNLIRLALPFMRYSGRGKIINVSSVSGMLAMPTMASYSASKYALEGASEALWYEMKPLGIDVTLVQPGFVNSDSFKNVYYSPEAQGAEMQGHLVYADYYNSMSPFIAKMMNQSRTTPEDVARTIFKVIRKRRPKLRVPATPDALVFYYLHRLIPRSILHQILFKALPNSARWGKNYSHIRTYE